MGIEEDIKQKRPFKSEVEKLVVNMMFTHGWIKKNLKSQCKPFGLTPKQYNILRILAGADKPLTTSVIRNRMIDRMSDITRLIDRLILKKLVIKKVKAEDKRLVDITISEKGLNLVKAMRADFTHDYMSGLDKNEVNQLNHLLDKLRSGT